MSYRSFRCFSLRLVCRSTRFGRRRSDLRPRPGWQPIKVPICTPCCQCCARMLSRQVQDDVDCPLCGYVNSSRGYPTLESSTPHRLPAEEAEEGGQRKACRIGLADKGQWRSPEEGLARSVCLMSAQMAFRHAGMPWSWDTRLLYPLLELR
jgi:hypothetical protein